jgi:hypothetical protein
LEDYTHYYGKIVVEIILPIISENIQKDDSLIRECGILSLGIISQAQNTDLPINFLKDHCDFLLDQMNDSVSIIKTTSMWTLSKYCNYISSTNEICTKYISNILNLMNFEDVQVQQAALNSFLSLIETSESKLLHISFDEENQRQQHQIMRIVEKIPESSPISKNFKLMIDTFTTCLNSYKDVTNFIFLYDAITLTFEFIKPEIVKKNQNSVEKLLEELMKRLKKSFEFDDEISAILSCLTSIAVSHEKIFENYAEELVKICLKNLKDFYNPNVRKKKLNPEGSSGIHNEFKEIIIACIDFISETLHMIPNKKSSGIGSKLTKYAIESIRDDDSDVKQSGFGLLGELIKLNVNLFKEQSLTRIYPVFNECIDDERPVANNGIWALGELSIRCTEQSLHEFISSFIPKLIEKLDSSVQDQHLGATIALTLGRLEINFPSLIEPVLPKFFKNWCKSILNSKQNSSTKNENDSVFSALVSFIRVNSKVSLENIELICLMINRWEERNLLIEQDLLTNLFYLKSKSMDPNLESIFEKNKIKLFQVSRFENFKSCLNTEHFSDVIIK